MKSVDIAGAFVSRYADEIEITNLKLNKLVYFAQVESLRSGCAPLFSDAIEAWEYGPVEPDVYRAFKHWGRSRIPSDAVGACDVGEEATPIIDVVARSYGRLSAFDLVAFSHREGGAWRNVYDPDEDKEITVDDIRCSADMRGLDDLGKTVYQRVDAAASSIPNALRLLQNS